MKKIFLIIIILVSFFSWGNCSAQKLSLKESIDIAKTNSEAIAIAKARVEAAEAVCGQAFSAMLPQIRIEAAIGRSYADPAPITVPANTFAPGLPPADEEFSFVAHETDVVSYSGNVTQMLFSGGLIWNTWKIANLGSEIAKEEYRKAEIDLTYNVATAFYNVIKAYKSFELAKEANDLAKKHLSQTRMLLNTGVLTRSEMLRSELEVAKTEFSLSKSKRGMNLASNSFNILLGRDFGSEISLNEEDFSVGELTAPNYKEYFEVALQNRPDLNTIGLGEEIADKQKWIAYSGYLPSLLLSGTLGQNHLTDSETKTESELENRSIMLVASWTIFDGLKTPNKVKEAYAKYSEAIKSRDLLIKKVAMEVNDACLALNSAVEELAASKKAFELSEENYKISEQKFASGVNINLEVIDARTELTSAKLNYLQAQFDYELAKASVNKAVGFEVLGKKNLNSVSDVSIILHGTVKFIPIEGGFMGFTDEKGNKYYISGTKVLEIKSLIGSSQQGKKIKIVGKIRKDIYTIQMWGQPLDVIDFMWE